jgi:hypothetical protein
MILYPAEAKNQWLNPLWILGYHHDIEMSPSTFYYLSLYIYIFFFGIPVVPHKAVAEVSKIGSL